MKKLLIALIAIGALWMLVPNVEAGGYRSYRYYGCEPVYYSNVYYGYPRVRYYRPRYRYYRPARYYRHYPRHYYRDRYYYRSGPRFSMTIGF